MDAFLRRVITQRDLEQEAAIIATPVEALVQKCRVCGRRTPGPEIPVCTSCGGRKVADRLALADAVAAAKEKHRNRLLKFARINPEEQMANPRLCSQCSKVLHGRIVGDLCVDCRSPSTDGGGVQSVRRSGGKDVLKRFKVVANALGADPDKLISDFAEGWLEQVKRSVQQG